MSKELSEMTIAELVEYQRLAQAFVEKAVIEARRGHSSWAAIASSLGVSPQEAHRRYAHIWKYVAAAEGLPSGDSSK